MLAMLPMSAQKAIYLRLIRLFPSPISFNLTSIAPDTYVSWIPDRYSSKYNSEVAKSAWEESDSISKFIRGNEAANCGDLTRYYLFRLIFDQLLKEGIKGDVAELGVYKGNTAVLLAQTARSMGTMAYLLDTFEGFSTTDLIGPDSDKQIQFEDSSLDIVRALVGETGVCYVKGHFPESAEQLPPSMKFVIVHIDCDLGIPYRAALEYFYPRLVRGGFLIMHDYSNIYWKGAESAIDQFFGDKPEKLIPIPDKSGTAIIRKL